MIARLLTVSAALCWPGACSGDLNVAYQWDRLDLALRDDGPAAYVPENNVAHRLRVWDGALYVAVPRFRRGVPATLCRSDGDRLHAFPSAGLQTPGNCVALQNVKDIEIDHLGQLWVLDTGVVYELDAAAAANRTCDPKLVVLNATTGAIVRSAVMPPAVYAGRAVLSGLSVDLTTLTAVVADIGPDDPGFIVYNLAVGVYRKFRYSKLHTAAGYDEALLTVSPVDRMVYFTTVRSDRMYAVPVSVFAAPLVNDVGRHVNDQGRKTDAASTAMAMDTTGRLYVAYARKVVAWNTLGAAAFDAAELFVQEVRLEWVSSMAFDARGYLWMITSPFAQFLAGGPGPRRPGVKLFKRYCGTTSFALQAAAAGRANGTATAGTRNAAAIAGPSVSAMVALAAASLAVWSRDTA